MEGILIAWPRSSMTQEQILAEIAQAGYDGAPASHGRNPDALRAGRTQVSAGFRDATLADEIVQRATEMAPSTRALGLTELYVAPLIPERRAVSERVSSADVLSDDDYRMLADTLNRVGEATLQHGVRACFHNHVGSFIETRAEIDHLFSLVDRSIGFQWLDINPLVLAEGVANG